MQQISESELILMKIIWDHGGTALYSTIMDTLEQFHNDWKKNTVLTLLSRLVYDGNVKNLVSTLLQQEILSSEEFTEIEHFWNNANAKSK